VFAPDSWVEKFDAIPQEGLKCFAGVVKSFKNDEVYSNDDFDEVKAELEAKCSTYKAELSGFFGTVSSTVKSLPESFLDAAKKFGSRVKSLSQKLKKAVSNKAQQRGNDPKKHAARLAKAAARFTDELAEISEADREQISNTFPKLEPFFSGKRDTF
jgi:oligoendopeptidase F